MVSPQPRRHHSPRREPAQEVRGHLPVRLRDRWTGQTCGPRCSTSSASGSIRACASSGSTIPHTKPFAFWEWLIACVHADVPEVIFLAEAFTRPRVMEHLARIGFSQSYTYFTWRTTKWELETYLTQLTAPGTAAYFRPNLWPNTPDILPDELVDGGRGAFLARLVLAATLSASYGIYGPVFELQEHTAEERGIRGVPALREVRGPLVGPRQPHQPGRLRRRREPDPARPRGPAVQ